MRWQVSYCMLRSSSLPLPPHRHHHQLKFKGSLMTTSERRLQLFDKLTLHSVIRLGVSVHLAKRNKNTSRASCTFKWAAALLCNRDKMHKMFVTWATLRGGAWAPRAAVCRGSRVAVFRCISQEASPSRVEGWTVAGRWQNRKFHHKGTAAWKRRSRFRQDSQK